ncbi:MAG: hypothetical protein V4498_00570 [candidate division FCPU426 bacterium]
MKKPDVSVQNHGSICIINFTSKAAQSWREEHIPAEAQGWGPYGVAVEPRYVEDILEGIQNDGLIVAGV